MRYEQFAQVALSYLNQLHSAARRLTRTPVDAEDLVQETYRLAFQHHRELRDLGQCRAWLYRILHRQAVTEHRRSARRPLLVAIDGGAEDGISAERPPAISDDMLTRLSLAEIRAAIDALPMDLRTAVTLCDIEGFSYEEIADITGCPVGTVRSRIARARTKLMGQLKEHAEACGIRRTTS